MKEAVENNEEITIILDGGEVSNHSLAHEMRGAGVFVNESKFTVKSGKITKNTIITPPEGVKGC